jgi:pyruvate,orthophosphate dikinase
MILAETVGAAAERRWPSCCRCSAGLHRLFEIMAGLPVTIRLLDPPLHEFLPATDEEMEAVAAIGVVSVEKCCAARRELHEFNPMLGHRGCRIWRSPIPRCRMQARAIFEAAIEAAKDRKRRSSRKSWCRWSATKPELDFVKARIDAVAEAVMARPASTSPISVGTMIELPRAAPPPPTRLPKSAEFFSFGTNDLTQTTFGISRDDAGLPGTYQRRA